MKLGDEVLLPPNARRSEAIEQALCVTAIEYGEEWDFPGEPMRITVVAASGTYELRQTGALSFRLVQAPVDRRSRPPLDVVLPCRKLVADEDEVIGPTGAR